MLAIPFDEFAKLVHDALNRLYDSPYLHGHPLVAILVTADRRAIQPSRELRRILLQAIRTMRPQPGTPAQSPDWRAYRILELRYLEGLSPMEATEALALSRSQFFRDQARILGSISEHLWRQRIPAEEATVELQSRTTLAESEVLRLSGDATWESLDLVQIVESLRELLERLARSKGTSLRFGLAPPMKELRVDRVMLRQALLSALTYAIDRAPGGVVCVDSSCGGGTLGLDITAAARAPITLDRRQGVGLHVGQGLMSALHGALEIVEDAPGKWAVRLSWTDAPALSPGQTPPILLVVDDNKEFANLCRRYIHGYAWHVLSAANSYEARHFATTAKPTMILLDIMMPTEDGWELLTWLKAEPNLCETPVVVCSVLNEPDLAKMLGAAAYLTKPVSQEQLLQTLARWARPVASPALVP